MVIYMEIWQIYEEEKLIVLISVIFKKRVRKCKSLPLEFVPFIVS
jgi:hypothetical protein